MTGDALVWLISGPWPDGSNEDGHGERFEFTPVERGIYNFQLVAVDRFGAEGYSQTSGMILVYEERSCTTGTLTVQPSPIRVAPGASGAVAATIDPNDLGWIQLTLEDGADALSDVVSDWTFTPALSQDPNEASRTLAFTVRPDVVVGETFELEVRACFYEAEGGSACGIPVQVEIVDPGANQEPVVTIQSPIHGAQYPIERPLSFEGLAVDPEDGALSGASLVWTSDLDGIIGTGEAFERSDLSVGRHIVDLTASDSKGATGSAAISFEIAFPTLCDRFTLAVAPTSVQATRFATLDIAVTRLSAFARPITLSLTGPKPPEEVFSLVWFQPPVVTGTESTLDLTVLSTIPIGQTYDFTVVGESNTPASICYAVFSLTTVP